MKKVLLLFPLFFLLGLVQLNCLDLPNDVLMPEWDVELNVPLLNKRYTLDEIIKTQQYISAESSPGGSIYLIQSDKYYLKSEVVDFIQVTLRTDLLGNIIPAAVAEPITLYLNFPEGAELDSAAFNGGSFSYNVENPSAVPVTVTIEVPGIIKPNGSPLVLQTTVAANAADFVVYSFENHKYKLPQDQPEQYKNSLKMKVSAAASITAGTFVLIDFYSSDFFFSSVSGYIPEKSLGRKREAFSLGIGDVLDYREKVSLKEASLNLSAEYKSLYSGPFDIEIRGLRLIGLRKDGTQIFLKDNTGSSDLNFEIKGGSFAKSFNQDNSNITEFIAFLPDSVILDAEYIMNPDNRHGTASIMDTVIFEADFSTRSFLSIRKSTIEDTTSLDLSRDDRDAIKDGRGASLTIETTNAIPLTTWFKIILTDKDYKPLTVITHTKQGSDSLFFTGAEVNQNGEVVNPTHSISTVELDSAQIDKIFNAEYAIFSISVNTKDASLNPPPLVAIRPSNWINIKVYGGVKYRLKPKD